MTQTANYLLFFAGVFLLTAATVVGVGAFEYEVASLGVVEEIPDDTETLVAYDRLPERDRAVVARAIDGERLVFRDPSALPGEPERRGKLAVTRDGETHLLTRRVFFNPRTSFGTASLAMAVAGLAALSESIRRQHFPHRTAYWTRR